MPCTPCFSDVFSSSPEMEARLRECEQRFGKLSRLLESQHFFFSRVRKPLSSECVPLKEVNQCNGLRTHILTLNNLLTFSLSSFAFCLVIGVMPAQVLNGHESWFYFPLKAVEPL